METNLRPEKIHSDSSIDTASAFLWLREWQTASAAHRSLLPSPTHRSRARTLVVIHKSPGIHSCSRRKRRPQTVIRNIFPRLRVIAGHSPRTVGIGGE